VALLFDEDYNILSESGLVWEEDEGKRFLIIKNYPLVIGFYTYNSLALEQVEVLCVIPPDYNSSGADMFWVHPALVRVDGKPIPNTSSFGGEDPRYRDNKEYCRWSRHFTADSWKPKIDNIQKILDRIEWALTNPNANK
jgi:hypothetical protein